MSRPDRDVRSPISPTPPANDDLALRLLRGESPTTEQLIRLIGPLAPENLRAQLGTDAKWLKPDQQLYGAEDWAGRYPGGFPDELGAACLILTLRRAAQQREAGLPGEAEREHLSALLDKLEIVETWRMDAALHLLSEVLCVTDQERGGLLSLCGLPAGRARHQEAHSPWWQLRREQRAALAERHEDEPLEAGVPELALMTRPLTDPDLEAALQAWDDCAARCPNPRRIGHTSIWAPAQRDPDALSELWPELHTQARAILGALDTHNPEPHGGPAWDAVRSENLLTALDTLSVPTRSRSEASGVLLNLWIMTRLPQHWLSMLEPVWSQENASCRCPEADLLRVLIRDWPEDNLASMGAFDAGGQARWA